MHPQMRPACHKKKSKPKRKPKPRPKPQAKRKVKPKQEPLAIIDLTGPDEPEIKKEPKRRKVDRDLVAEEEEEKTRREQQRVNKGRPKSPDFPLLGADLAFYFDIKDLLSDDVL